MAHNPRHDDILQIINRLRSVTVGELTDRTGVSEVTIRKDLKMLEEMGFVVRTHGGAQLAEDRSTISTLATREKVQMTQKERIADRAAMFINEGDTIYLDSGSTCALLASVISAMNISVVTNSLTVMQILADAPGIVLHAVGGNYRKDAGSFLGPGAIRSIRNVRIETCFVGATGIALDGSFSTQNLHESEVKREVLAVSNRRIILADSSKIGSTAFAVFAGIGDVDVLITDSGFAEVEAIAVHGIEVIRAG
jgi:DeoR/GlpR family transcriptional regulator of sugar metabolism